MTEHTKLRQLSEDELKEILELYNGGYAPDPMIEDLQELFHYALNAVRENGDRVTLDLVNAHWAIMQFSKVLAYFNPERA